MIRPGNQFLSQHMLKRKADHLSVLKRGSEEQLQQIDNNLSLRFQTTICSINPQSNHCYTLASQCGSPVQPGSNGR